MPTPKKTEPFSRVNSFQDIQELKEAVKQLQREVCDQVALEEETQATLDHLQTNVGALQTAFSTLSDVVMDEIDQVKIHCQLMKAAFEEQLKEMARAHRATVGELKSEVTALRTTSTGATDGLSQSLEATSGRAFELEKDMSVLKVSHSHALDWLGRVQTGQNEGDEQCANVVADQLSMNAALAKLTGELAAFQADHDRRLAAQLRGVREDLHKHDHRSAKHALDLQLLAEQRADDLQLFEKTSTALSQSNSRLRGSLDDASHTGASGTSALASRLDAVDANVAAVRLELGTQKQALDAQERDTRVRLAHVGKLLEFVSVQGPAGEEPLPPPPGAR